MRLGPGGVRGPVLAFFVKGTLIAYLVIGCPFVAASLTPTAVPRSPTCNDVRTTMPSIGLGFMCLHVLWVHHFSLFFPVRTRCSVGVIGPQDCVMLVVAQGGVWC